MRQKFLIDVDTNPELYRPIDVKRCRSEDWQTERYVIDKKDTELALKALITAMRWKKRFGVHQRDHKYFSKKFFLSHGYQKYSVDKERRVVTWAHQHVYKKTNGIVSVSNAKIILKLYYKVT